MKVAGDFNQHDQPRGGEDVSLERESEADQINDVMSWLSAVGFMRYKTWQCGDF